MEGGYMSNVKYYIFCVVFLIFLFGTYGNIDAVCGLKEDVQNTIDKIKEDISVSAVTRADGTIIRVISADTYMVDIDGVGTQVKLIGVNAPKSVDYSGDGINTSYGIKATMYVSSLLPEGTKVWLKYDKETEDDDGASLAYVFTRDKNGKGYMINKRLLEKGYAETISEYPNNKYEKDFIKLELKAKENQLGIWKKTMKIIKEKENNHDEEKFDKFSFFNCNCNSMLRMFMAG